MTRQLWGGKPYHSLDYEMKKRFGEKVYKIALDGGMTCPNRDGTIGTGGCTFCSGSGSGDFAAPKRDSVTEQINQGIAGISLRKHVGKHFIAYFQSFSNTYAPIEVLRALYTEALRHPLVTALSVATRPDCLPADVLELLVECSRIKPVMVELGLQTIHETTAKHIHRGYPLSVYDTSVEHLKSRNLEIVTHVIAGLPGETEQDFLKTVSHVARVGSDGIKIHLLHVLENTPLAHDYRNGTLQVLTKDEYIGLVIKALAILPGHMVIHRLTGDGPKKLLVAPQWSSNKRQVLNEIHHRMKEQNIWQGKDYSPASASTDL